MTNRYLWKPLRKRFLSRLHAEENGQSLVIFSLFLTILIGILGIVLDVGYSNVMQRQMAAADAAALAGAHDLASSQGVVVAAKSAAGQRILRSHACRRF